MLQGMLHDLAASFYRWAEASETWLTTRVYSGQPPMKLGQGPVLHPLQSINQCGDVLKVWLVHQPVHWVALLGCAEAIEMKLGQLQAVTHVPPALLWATASETLSATLDLVPPLSVHQPTRRRLSVCSVHQPAHCIALLCNVLGFFMKILRMSVIFGP
jgi:hypothetical protein